MNKKILLSIPLMTLLASCSLFNQNPIDGPGQQDPGTNDPYQKDDGIDEEKTSGEEIEIEIKEEEEVVVTDSGEASQITDLTIEGISYDDNKKLFTISSAGEFTFTGSFNGNILVDADEEDEVKITLEGFTIKSTSDSPIKCISAGELQVSIKNGTKNYIYDYRATKTVDDDNQGNGAITSFCDMKLSGKGSLYIQAKYNNGIHCKDDLKIKPEVNNDSTIQIISYNNCLKGNDSLTIESGNLVLISTNGNAIKTENTDISSKGKQRGTVTITGGQIDIYSAKDAIDASYNVDISTATEGADPIINIYTSDFSPYSNEVTSTEEEQIYLKVSGTFNTTSYFYAVEFLNDDYSTSWAKTTLSKSDSRYKYFGVEKPANATAMKVFIFKSTVTELTEANADAKTDNYVTINSYYDTVQVSVSGSNIRLDRWVSYTSSDQGQYGPGGGGPGGGGMQEGNDNKAEVSAKGIKADNIINISGGTFFIKTYDDAIHANYGDTFENGGTGVGDVNISGGTFSIYASDDGIHADGTLTISGGDIDVSYSYEAIEGTIINFTGGSTRVYAVDDGVNAAQKNNMSPAINISGGLLDVTVYGQDVDGIDSNGTFTQTGGYVITKGANSQMSTGLDCDRTATISGGTFVAFGKTEKTPTTGSGITTYSLSGTYSAGTYKITFGDGTSSNTTSKYSCSVINVYSDSSTKITVTKA